MMDAGTQACKHKHAVVWQSVGRVQTECRQSADRVQTECRQSAGAEHRGWGTVAIKAMEREISRWPWTPHMLVGSVGREQSGRVQSGRGTWHGISAQVHVDGTGEAEGARAGERVWRQRQRSHGRGSHGVGRDAWRDAGERGRIKASRYVYV